MGVLQRRDGFFFFSYGFWGKTWRFVASEQIHHPGSFTGLKSVKCNNFLILQILIVVVDRAFRELSC